MKAARLDDDVIGPPPVTIEVDGVNIDAIPGETLATALLAAGIRTFRRTRSDAPRGPFCNMGVCFDCVVTVDGQAGIRACMSAVREGMRVNTGADAAS